MYSHPSEPESLTEFPGTFHLINFSPIVGQGEYPCGSSYPAAVLHRKMACFRAAEGVAIHELISHYINVDFQS
jgi:hypothetical protein